MIVESYMNILIIILSSLLFITHVGVRVFLTKNQYRAARLNPELGTQVSIKFILSGTVIFLISILCFIQGNLSFSWASFVFIILGPVGMIKIYYGILLWIQHLL
jgi:hypothetical protein